MATRKKQAQGSPVTSIILLVGVVVLGLVGYSLYSGRDIKRVKVGPGGLEVKYKKHHQHEAPAAAQAVLTP